MHSARETWIKVKTRTGNALHYPSNQFTVWVKGAAAPGSLGTHPNKTFRIFWALSSGLRIGGKICKQMVPHSSLLTHPAEQAREDKLLQRKLSKNIRLVKWLKIFLQPAAWEELNHPAKSIQSEVNHEQFSASSIQQKEKNISGFCWNQWRRSEVVRFQAVHPIFQDRKGKVKVAIWQGCGWLHLTPCKASGSNTWLTYLGHSQDQHTRSSEDWLLSARIISECFEVPRSTNSA